MKKLWIRLLLLIGAPLAVAAVVAVLFPSEDKTVWALYALVSLLYVSVAILYIIGLRAFKQEFRVGYWYLAAAMVLYAVGLLELPIFKDIIVAGEGALAPIYYVAVLPILAGVIVYYLGLRKIASIIALKTILLSPIAVGGAAIIIGGSVALFALLTTTDPDPISLAIPLGVLGAALTCVLASVVLLFRLRRGVSALYRPAFAWSFYGFIALFLGQVFDPAPFLPAGHWYIEYSLAVPLLPSALCFLKAAFEFNRIPYKESAQVTTASGQQLSSIDIILAVAQFVSNPKTIDPELDTLRALTAKRENNQQPLTDQQQIELADLYKRLETFLIQKEPTRSYTAHWLRQMVEVRFGGSVNEPVFWQRFKELPAATSKPLE